MTNWKNLGKKKLFGGTYITVEEHQVDRGDGKPYPFEFLHYNNEAVGIIAYDRSESGKLLLVRQFRYFTGKHLWEIPAGGIDRDEQPAAAASRELLEETGIHAPLSKYMQFYPSSGGSDQKFHIFIGELSSACVRDKSGVDPLEISEVRWFSISKVKEMILDNEIQDGLTLGALGRFFLAKSDIG